MNFQSVARFLFILVMGTSGGCATVIKGLGQDVTFTSTPPGAEIYVNGKHVGRTPVTARVTHGKDKQVEARLDGYLTKQSTITTSFSGYSLCLLYFSLLGDLLTGSMFTVDVTSLHLRLDPIPSLVPAAPVPPNTPVPLPATNVSGKAKLLAVLEFKGKNLDRDVLDTLSDEVRGGALDGIQGRAVDVITRESMLAIQKDMGKGECTEGDCEVETGRNIGADYIVTGNVVLMDQTYVVTLKLLATDSGALKSTESAEAANRLELKRLLREKGRKLLVTVFGAGPARR